MTALLYGTYTTIIDSFRPKGIHCYNCNSKNQMVVEKTTNVFHIFYIPCIPFWTKNTFTCKSCNNVFELRDLSPDLKTYYSDYKSKKRILIWLFTGPILALIGMSWFAFSQMNFKNELLQRLTDGKQTKIIEYKTENGTYTTMKTIKISEDSIWLSENKLVVGDYEYIDRITAPNNYSEDTIKISTTDLIKILDKREIKAVYPSR